jgi:hypothetical protein
VLHPACLWFIKDPEGGREAFAFAFLGLYFGLLVWGAFGREKNY